MKENEIIIGHHAAVAVLENKDRLLFSLKCTKDFFNKNKKIIENRRIKKIEVVNRKVIDAETKNNFHQGVIIKSQTLQKKDINSISEDEKLIVILDSLNDSQNVGSILRTSYLFGIKTVIFNKDNSLEVNPFLIKAASGAYEKINLIEVINLNRTIEILKKKGFWILGLDVKSEKNLTSIPRDIKKAVIFGSEGKGIRSLILKNCDYRVKINIPINDESIDSLNVSNSVAITLYECLKK